MVKKMISKSVRWMFDCSQWSISKTDWFECLKSIQAEERARINRFVFQNDAISSMVGRLMIRKLLTEHTSYGWGEIKLLRDTKGKPYLDNVPHIAFNVSHHGPITILAAEIFDLKDEKCMLHRRDRNDERAIFGSNEKASGDGLKFRHEQIKSENRSAKNFGMSNGVEDANEEAHTYQNVEVISDANSTVQKSAVNNGNQNVDGTSERIEATASEVVLKNEEAVLKNEKVKHDETIFEQSRVLESNFQDISDTNRAIEKGDVEFKPIEGVSEIANCERFSKDTNNKSLQKANNNIRQSTFHGNISNMKNAIYEIDMESQREVTVEESSFKHVHNKSGTSLVANLYDIKLGVDICNENRTLSGSTSVSEYFRIMKRIFHDKEWTYILSDVSDTRQQLINFYRVWSLKESYVKATGSGIGVELGEICFLVRSRVKEEHAFVYDTELFVKDVRQLNWVFEETRLESKQNGVFCVAVAFHVSGQNREVSCAEPCIDLSWFSAGEKKYELVEFEDIVELMQEVDEEDFYELMASASEFISKQLRPWNS